MDQNNKNTPKLKDFLTVEMSIISRQIDDTRSQPCGTDTAKAVREQKLQSLQEAMSILMYIDTICQERKRY